MIGDDDLAALVRAYQFELVNFSTGQTIATMANDLFGSGIVFHHHDAIVLDSRLGWTDDTITPSTDHSVGLSGPADTFGLNPPYALLGNIASTAVYAKIGTARSTFPFSSVELGVETTAAGASEVKLSARTARLLTESGETALGANFVVPGGATGFLTRNMTGAAGDHVYVTASCDVRLTAAGTGVPVIYLLWSTPTVAFAFDPRQAVGVNVGGFITRRWRLPFGVTGGAGVFQLAASRTGTALYTIVTPHTELLMEVESTR